MNRAKASANRPKVSGSMPRRLTNLRRAASGWSRRSVRSSTSRSTARPARRSRRGWLDGVGSDTAGSLAAGGAVPRALRAGQTLGLVMPLLTPVLGEDVVQHIVDSDRAEQASLVVG